MPRIAEFYGIIIAMFYNEHEPAHFHAIYGEHRALFRINPVQVIGGTLPRRAQRLVTEWAAMHQIELLNNWRRARERQPLSRIDPLE